MNLLCACFVPLEVAQDWAGGRLNDLEVWRHPESGTGTALFVAEMEGRLAWRGLAQLVRSLPPAQIIFRTKLDSMVRRSHLFGARACYKDAPGNYRYFADGPELAAFLKSLGAEPCRTAPPLPA